MSDFEALQEALSDGQAWRLTYFAFNLLHLDGEDSTGLPLVERKARLEKLIGSLRAGPIRYSECVIGLGPEFFREACKAGLEGILSKRASAPYRPGRNGAGSRRSVRGARSS